MKQRNMNFRQTKSDRNAEGAYSNYKRGLVKNIKNENLKIENRTGKKIK